LQVPPNGNHQEALQALFAAIAASSLVELSIAKI